MDRIFIENITVYGYHGVLPGERSLGQEFQASVELEVDLSGLQEDCLDRVLDYRAAVEAVCSILAGPPCRLLETLAAHIAALLLDLPGVEEAAVRVGKPKPPLPEVRGGVWVEIRRRKGGQKG